jgi:sugar-specific transcriptional regulator TrmB
MALPRFFRLAKPRQFHYEPVFYDERKEKLQERIRETEQKLGIKLDGDYKRTLTKGSFTSHRIAKKKTNKQSTLRLIIIFLVLVLISYLLLFF